MSYKAWLQAQQALQGADLAGRLRSEGNFMLSCNPGDVVVIPSGFLLVTLSGGGCTYFRKSASPKYEGEDQRVHRCVSTVLEAYPELQQTQWSQWASVVG